MTEKFLTGLKSAIESGKDTDWGYNGEDEVPYDIFDSDIALASVVKYLEGQSSWIPIEKVELVPGENYDTFSVEYGRMPECKWNGQHFECRFLRPSLEFSQVTHIMKRPADPEI